MAEYSASFNESGALEFDGAAIEDLVSATRDYVSAAPVITIEFDGEHKISSADLGQLFSDPYMRSLRIRSLKIDGTQYNPRRSCTINLDTEYTFLGVARVTLSGERDAAVITRDRIEKTVKGCLVWYWPLFRPARPGFIVFRIIAAATLIFVGLFCVYTLLRGMPTSDKDALIQAGESLLLTPFFYQVGMFFGRRLFPKLLFNFGKSADAIRAAAHWRNIVFVGFGLAVIASIAATLITNRLK